MVMVAYKVADENYKIIRSGIDEEANILPEGIRLKPHEDTLQYTKTKDGFEMIRVIRLP